MAELSNEQPKLQLQLQPQELEKEKSIHLSDAPTEQSKSHRSLFASHEHKHHISNNKCTEGGDDDEDEIYKQFQDVELSTAPPTRNITLTSKPRSPLIRQKSPRIGRIFRKTSQDQIDVAKSGHATPSQEDHVNSFSINTDYSTPPPLEDEEDTTTWKDVFNACCCHSKTEWVSISIGISMLLGCLYLFLMGLELLGTSFKVRRIIIGK
jgi:hypothetical protein